KYLSKINYTYLTTSCLLPIFTRKLVLHDYLNLTAELFYFAKLDNFFQFFVGCFVINNRTTNRDNFSKEIQQV
ncbi:MAG: hypothetical protein EHM73_01415, partial [Chroococcales cyanobacterium metabat2.561]